MTEPVWPIPAPFVFDVPLDNPPLWAILQGPEGFGRDLRELEKECRAELGVAPPETGVYGFFESRETAVLVASCMMRKNKTIYLRVTTAVPAPGEHEHGTD